MTPTPETADIAVTSYCSDEQNDGTSHAPTSHAADIAGLVERLRDPVAEAIRGDGSDFADGPWETLPEKNKHGWRGDADRALAVVKDYLTPALQSLSAELAEARRQWRNYEAAAADQLARATTAEAEARAMREALEQAKLYVERDEEAHGRKFGTGNAIRAALAREGK